MILDSCALRFPETVPWLSLLGVLSRMSGLRLATEATPVPVTGWARGWEPACLTWSSLSMTSWQLLSLTEQLLCARWVLMSVSAAAATWKWLQSLYFFKFNLSLSRVEVSSETHKGFPPPRLPSSIILSLRPELLLWYGCIPGKSYWFHPTWGVCTAGQVLHRQGTGCKLPLKHLNDQTLLLSVCVRYHYLRGLVNTVSNRRVDALEDFQSLYKTDSDIFPVQMVKSLVDSLTEAERLQVSCETQSFLDAFSVKSRN